MRPIVRIVAWLAGLSGSLLTLLALGAPVPPPPVLDLDALSRWVQHTDPAVATFSILRVFALGVVAYLLVSTLTLLAAEVTRVPVLVAAASRFAAPVVRHAVRGAVGAGLVAAIAATATPAFAAPAARTHLVVDATDAVAARSTDPVDPLAPATDGPAPPAPDDLTLVHLGPATSDPTTPPSTTSTAPTTTTAPSATTAPQAASAPAPTPPPPLTIEPGPSPTGTGPRPAPAPPPDAAAVPDPHGATAPAPPTAAPPSAGGLAAGARTIVTGDHLWGIAEQTLAAAWSDPPRPDEIAAYLQRLIAENRSVLIVADDPDLVLPGQVFALPAVGPR